MVNRSRVGYVDIDMTVKRSTISRRRALAGAAGVGVGVPLLVACGDDGTEGASASSPSARTTSAGPQPEATPTATKATAKPPADAGIPTSDVPVGGGIIQGDVVVTQPVTGEFKAFTAVCTHAQCLVGEVSGGTINCPCHGSQFSIEDGSVAAGPAPTPLAEVDLIVERDRVVVG